MARLYRVVEMGLFRPVQDLAEIVIRWVFDELLRSFVVSWSDVLHAVVEHQFRLLTLHVHQTWFHLAVLVLDIFQIQRTDLALRVGGDHGACNAHVEQLLHAVAED